MSVVRWLLAVGLAVVAACVRAADAEPPPAFRVEIVAPSPLDDALRDNLDIMRWQRYDALTDDLLELLRAEARTQARDIAGTQGFFSPRIEVRAERDCRRPGGPHRRGAGRTDARAGRCAWSSPER